METLEDAKRSHNQIVYISVGVVVGIASLLLGLVILAGNASGGTAYGYVPGQTATGHVATTKTFSQQAVAKEACNFSNAVCAILNKQQRIAYDANTDRSGAPYDYTAAQMRTIRNHPGQLGNSSGLTHYNHPASDWNRGHAVAGGVKMKLSKHAFGSDGKRGCINWERWTFTGRQTSTLGAALFDYTMRVNACFARKANGSWKVTQLSANDTIENHSGWTVQVQGWSQNVSPAVPNDWSRISTTRRIDNCVGGWHPVCSRGWTVQIQMVVFGINHFNYEQNSWV